MTGNDNNDAEVLLQERINPETVALIVIDMQNDFVSPQGKMAEFGFYIDNVRETIQPIEAILEAARSWRCLVIHTSMINDINQNPNSWYSFWGEPAVTIPGSWGAKHIDEITPNEDELVITKYTYSAFEGTNLNTILRRKGIQTVIVVGTDINICAGQTIHQAFALGYHVVAVSDCLACFARKGDDHSRQLLEMGLYLIENHYGTVVTSQQLIKVMKTPR
jgi:ureidoacrylate peracid hydrolase